MNIKNSSIHCDPFEWCCPLTGDEIISEEGFTPNYATWFILHDDQEKFKYINTESSKIWASIETNFDKGKYNTYSNEIFETQNEFFTKFEIFLNEISKHTGNEITIYKVDDECGFSGDSTWIGMLKP